MIAVDLDHDVALEFRERPRTVLPPAPTNAFDLGRHMIEQHGYAVRFVDALDGDDLRRSHRNAHAWADDCPGVLKHVHRP